MPVSATPTPRRTRRRRVGKSGEDRSGKPLPDRSTWAVSAADVVGMLAICVLVCRPYRWISLHHEIARCAWDAVFIRPVVNDGNVTAEIVVRGRRCGGPFESCGLPGIVAGFFSEFHAPEEIKQEDELAGDRNEGGVGHECLQPNQIVQVF